VATAFDFSTPEARQRNAEAEVRLNPRLACGVYIGAVPLTLGVDRHLAMPATASPSTGWSRWCGCRRSVCWIGVSPTGIGISARAERLAHFFATAWQAPARAVVARLRAITALVVPTALPWRNPEPSGGGVRMLVMSRIRHAAIVP
jgi:hypothetical protein